MKNNMIRALRKMGIIWAAILMFVFFAITSPFFLSLSNVLSIAQQCSINLVIALGMSFVVATGGIDLSVGAIVALSSVITTSLITKQSIPLWCAIPLSLLAGTLAGGLNGVLISKVKLQPFIVTLASVTYLRGFALVYTNGRPIYGIPDEFVRIFAGKINGFPVIVFWALGATIVAVFLMNRTRLGEYTLAIGGNEEATRISGVNTDRVKIAVYGISGFLSAIAGLMLAAKLKAGEPASGSSYELDAIAAVVMGGTALSGGIANMFGTIAGALILSILANGLTLLNVQSYWQQVITGFVILGAVLLDRRRTR